MIKLNYVASIRATVVQCERVKFTATNRTAEKKKMLFKKLIVFFALIYFAHGLDDKARYDNYRIYNVHLKTDDQVKIFQEIEAHTDSYMFMGHPRKANQYLTFLVAAHKVADLTDILNANKFGYTILVSSTPILVDS